MKNLILFLFIAFGFQNSWAMSCSDFTGIYKCLEGGQIELKQNNCNLLLIKETNSQGQSIDITWITDGVAHYEEPGAYSRVTWTAYHSTDGIHHFVGAYDSYKKETVTYRRHLNLDANRNLAIYYFKARNGVTEREQTSKCVP
jgi:hypothetical protein